jgi:hypothetical protein
MRQIERQACGGLRAGEFRFAMRACGEVELFGGHRQQGGKFLPQPAMRDNETTGMQWGMESRGALPLVVREAKAKLSLHIGRHIQRERNQAAERRP